MGRTKQAIGTTTNLYRGKMELTEWVQPYSITLVVLTTLAALMFIQVLVADVAMIRSKHLPGHPVKADHNNFLFRATRAQANTSETVLIYVICALLCMVLSVKPGYANAFSVVYIVGRLGHMLCYYFDFRAFRSLSFAVSMLGIASMLGAVIWAVIV